MSREATMDAHKPSAKPRYVQVADDLRNAIQQQVYPVGALLPTETILCKTYSVSRFTVREALRQLQEEGLVSRRRGSGTQVSAQHVTNYRQTVTRLSDLTQYAPGTVFDFEPYGPVVADTGLAGLIGGKAGQHWFLLTGVQSSPSLDRVTCASAVFIDPRFNQSVAQLRPGEQPLFQQLQALHGFRCSRISQDIKAVCASEEVAQQLGIEPGDPCLRMIRTYFDQDGAVFEVAVNTHPGDAFSYTMEFTPSPPGA